MPTVAGQIKDIFHKLTQLTSQITPISSIPDENVILDIIGTPTYDNLHQWLNNTCSAMCISGGAVTASGANEIDVAAGKGILKITDNEIGENVQFDWAAELNIAIANNETTWVGIEYNAGSPQVKTDTNLANFNFNTDFILARAYNHGGTVCALNAGSYYSNFQHKVCYRFFDVDAFTHAAGAIIADAGNLDFSITEGRFYCGTTPFTFSLWDCSGASRFTAWYRDGGVGWTTVPAQADIDPLNWDDNTGVLNTLTAGRYGVFWVYICHDDNVHVQYGQGDYKHFEAEAAPVPAGPDFFAENAVLVGKIIVGQGAAVLTDVLSAFEEVFIGAAASVHNDLSGLQGGQADQYYHLNAAEHGYISGVNAQSLLKTASPYFVQLGLLDTGSDHELYLKCNENLAADRILNLVVGNAERTITLSGNPTLNDWFDQSVKQAASPTFVTAKLTALTDGYVPYHVSDAAGLANSGIFWDNANSRVGIGVVAPAEALEVVGNATIRDDGAVVLTVARYTANAFSPMFRMQKARGTEAAPGQVLSGDGLFRLQAVGRTDVGWSQTGNDGDVIQAWATENFTAAAQGRKLIFRTVDNGTTGGDDRMTIDHNGKVGIGKTPNQQLDIAGGMIWLDSSGNAYLIVDRATAARRGCLCFMTAGDSSEAIPATGLQWALGTPDSDIAGLDGSEFFIGQEHSGANYDFLIKTDGGIFIPGMKAGANQGAAGAAANELWRDTADNSVKLGV